MAFKFQHGVIVAVDSRATAGSYIGKFIFLQHESGKQWFNPEVRGSNLTQRQMIFLWLAWSPSLFFFSRANAQKNILQFISQRLS